MPLKIDYTMKFIIPIIVSVFFSLLGYGQNELPDNYLPITFRIQNNKLVGAGEYLEGFTFSMDFRLDSLIKIPQKDELFKIIQSKEITGILTYPNNRETDIKYEIVNHRGIAEIYMKTTLGYFLWEMLNIKKEELSIAIYWWYCPPATRTDLEVLNLADSLLSDSNNWHQNDDRKCEDDTENRIWSLFCALKFASIEIAKEYNHHNTAIQTVRFVIDDMQPDHGYNHTLMDFNNSTSTCYSDIIKVIDEAKKRIKKELENHENE